MIKFIAFIVLLVILFFALMFGHTLIGQEGMVIIALPDTVVEMSIISAIIVAFFSLLVLWIVVFLLRRVIRLLIGSRNWFGSYSKRQQQKAFHRALNAYLIGDFKVALASVQKSFGGDFAGTNYMLAADIDARINQGNNVDVLLAQAQVDDNTKGNAYLKQAQLALLDNQAAKCIDLLNDLSDKDQKRPLAIQLRLQALAKLDRWGDVKNVLPENKKALGDEYITWAQRATHGEFAEVASKHGANALKEKWQNMSRSARKDIANQVCYVQLLIDQGMSSDAEAALVEFASKQEHDAYWGLFKQLNHSSPAKAIKFIEQKIKRQPENAKLYSVLAHLAYNSEDYSLAERAVNKALELKRNQQDLLLLASILEKREAYESANLLYKGLVD